MVCEVVTALQFKLRRIWFVLGRYHPLIVNGQDPVVRSRMKTGFLIVVLMTSCSVFDRNIGWRGAKLRATYSCFYVAGISNAGTNAQSAFHLW